MNIPDKVPYRTGEKIAEILTGLLYFLFVVVQIFIIANHNTDGSEIIMIPVSFMIYSSFTIASFCPQWTNLVNSEKNCNQHNFHSIRISCIIAKMILLIAISIISLL